MNPVAGSTITSAVLPALIDLSIAKESTEPNVNLTGTGTMETVLRMPDPSDWKRLERMDPSDFNQWSEAKVKKLQEWAHLSQIYSLCHTRAQERFSRRFSWLSLTLILLNSGNIAIQSVNVLLLKPVPALLIIGIILLALNTGLTLWLKTTDYSCLASNHEAMSKGYNRIILDIESELANEVIERINGVKFLRQIQERLISLSTGGQSIPDGIWESVETTLQVHPLTKDKIASQNSALKVALVATPPVTRTDGVPAPSQSEHERSPMLAQVIAAANPTDNIELREGDRNSMYNNPMMGINSTALPAENAYWRQQALRRFKAKF